MKYARYALFPWWMGPIVGAAIGTVMGLRFIAHNRDILHPPLSATTCVAIFAASCAAIGVIVALFDVRRPPKRTRVLDENTYASHPGNVPLSDERLRVLRPDLYGVTGLLKSVLSRIGCWYPERVHIEEQLRLGDSRAAIVVSTSPLLVAAYSADLDCVAMLRFPSELVETFRLEKGASLMTVNVYEISRRSAGDLVFGPQRSAPWTNFHPLIAEFLTDDHVRTNTRKQAIDEAEWQRALTLGTQYLQILPGVARDGRPILSQYPARVG